MKITRMLLSLVIAAMLIGFTAIAQDKKEEPKPKATEVAKAPEHKHAKKAMKTKMAHAKKKEVKEEKKEAAPPVK